MLVGGPETLPGGITRKKYRNTLVLDKYERLAEELKPRAMNSTEAEDIIEDDGKAATTRTE